MLILDLKLGDYQFLFYLFYITWFLRHYFAFNYDNLLINLLNFNQINLVFLLLNLKYNLIKNIIYVLDVLIILLIKFI